MPARVQCPQWCECSLNCRIRQVEGWLSGMFRRYRDEIGPDKGIIVFPAFRIENGVKKFKVAYELDEYNIVALRQCAGHLAGVADDGYNVYFQPNLIVPNWKEQTTHPSRPLSRPGNRKNPRYEEVYSAVGIFLDIDTYKPVKMPDGRVLGKSALVREAELILKTAGIGVSSIVRSGEGHHFHFRLSGESMKVDDVAGYTRRLIHLLREEGIPVDKSSSNGVQIARVPGTFNYKQSGNALAVKVIKMEGGVSVTREQLEALPEAPASSVKGKWFLSSLLKQVFGDVHDQEITIYRERITPEERDDIEFVLELDSNAAPAADIERQRQLPYKYEVEAKRTAEGKKYRDLTPSAHDFNAARQIGYFGVFDHRIKPDAKSLRDIARRVGYTIYTLRKRRHAAKQTPHESYYTVTAINALMLGSRKFRDAVWAAGTRQQLLKTKPKKIDREEMLEFTTTNADKNPSVTRMNRLMSAFGFVLQRRQGVVWFINRDHRDALRDKRRKHSPTEARVALTVKQIARLLRKRAADNAPNHHSVGWATLTGKELEALIRTLPHWQAARTLLARRSNIKRVTTSKGTVWIVYNIPAPDSDHPDGFPDAPVEVVLTADDLNDIGCNWN